MNNYWKLVIVFAHACCRGSFELNLCCLQSVYALLCINGHYIYYWISMFTVIITYTSCTFMCDDVCCHTHSHNHQCWSYWGIFMSDCLQRCLNMFVTDALNWNMNWCNINNFVGLENKHPKKLNGIKSSVIMGNYAIAFRALSESFNLMVTFIAIW